MISQVLLAVLLFNVLSFRGVQAELWSDPTRGVTWWSSGGLGWRTVKVHGAGMAGPAPTKALPWTIRRLGEIGRLRVDETITVRTTGFPLPFLGSGTVYRDDVPVRQTHGALGTILGRSISIPLHIQWPQLVINVVIFTALGIVVRLPGRRVRSGECKQCGYAKRGRRVGRCPECGCADVV
jgi:hypothetical protein